MTQTVLIEHHEAVTLLTLNRPEVRNAVDDVALACDIRLVSERGKFAELFIRLGLVPDGGGTYLLPRLIGIGRALEMLFTGADVDAQEAYRIGLANYVIPVETFMSDVLTFAT